MFAAEYERDGSNRRRGTRAPVSLDGGIERGGLNRALCRVVDISSSGARLQTYTDLTRGAAIRLTLPAVGTVAALIVWANDFTAGCRFVKPLTDRQYEALLDIEI